MKKKKIIIREKKLWTDEEYDFLKSVGNNIVRLKKENNLTSKQVCDELEMDKSNFRRIEAGRTNISLLLLRRIAKVLGTDLSEITGK